MGKIKQGICPQCAKELVRKRSMKVRKIKKTICGNCQFVIENPYEIFKPR